MKLNRLALVAMLTLAGFSSAYAQDNPFDEATGGNPFDSGTAPVPAANNNGRLGMGIAGTPEGQPVVRMVVPGGPAEQAGVRAGDIILQLQGRSMDSYSSGDELVAALQGEVGSTCTLQLLRNGQTIDVSVRRAAMDANGQFIPNSQPPVNNNNNRGPNRGGNLPAGFRPDVDATNLMAIIAPQAINARRPDIVQPGLHLVYYLGSAQIPGSPWQLVPDPEGTWVNKQTGQRYKEDYVSGSGGMGWNVFDVGYVDDQVVAGYNRSYSLDTVSRNSGTPGANWGAVFPAGLGGEYWCSTDVLNQLQEQRDGDLLIRRLQYPLNGRTYNAIRIQSAFENSRISYTYDLDTGLLIHYGSASQGKEAMITDPSGNARSGGGVMTIVSLFILDARNVPSPWANEPVPSWVSQFRRLQYQGVTTTGLAGSGFPDMEQPLSVMVESKGSNGQWARTVSHIKSGNSGYDLLDNSTSQECSTTGIAGSLFIPPSGLAKLQQGQILCEDPIVGNRLMVGAMDQRTVTISEVGANYRRDSVYDRQNGIMLANILNRNMGAGTSGHRIQLVGQE